MYIQLSEMYTLYTLHLNYDEWNQSVKLYCDKILNRMNTSRVYTERNIYIFDWNLNVELDSNSFMLGLNLIPQLFEKLTLLPTMIYQRTDVAWEKKLIYQLMILSFEFWEILIIHRLRLSCENLNFCQRRNPLRN